MVCVVCACMCAILALQATDFRTFWGDKSQVRRFQDGSINEAILWSGATSAERRTIPQQIVSHLLKRCMHLCDVVCVRV